MFLFFFDFYSKYNAEHKYLYICINNQMIMSLLHKFTTAVLTLGAIGVLFSCGPRYTYQTVEGDPLNARIYTLDNGLKVYMTVNDETPRIQTYIAVRVGGKDDP